MRERIWRVRAPRPHFGPGPEWRGPGVVKGARRKANPAHTMMMALMRRRRARDGRREGSSAPRSLKSAGSGTRSNNRKQKRRIPCSRKAGGDPMWGRGGIEERAKARQAAKR
eukprot:516180-Pyramimonas_sp.AAC.1